MFDREVVETLLKYVPLYPKGTMVTLSDGREAIIYENFGVHNLRPVVRLMDGELLDLSNEANYHITLRMKTESGFSTEEAEKERNEMIRPPVLPDHGCGRYEDESADAAWHFRAVI